MAAAPNPPNDPRLAASTVVTNTGPRILMRLNYCILDDCKHHVAFGTGVLDGGQTCLFLNPGQYETYTVAQLLSVIQEVHRTRQLRCSFCARAGSDKVLVKSAILALQRADNFAETYQDLRLRHEQAPQTVIFMQPWAILKGYIEGRNHLDVTVVLECTFQVETPVLSRERPLSDARVILTKRRRVEPDAGPPLSFCIPTDALAPADPVDLWRHSDSAPFSSYRKHPGKVFVDKTAFILKLVDLWNQPKGHYRTLALPPGMGVTTFLDTAVTWLDCNGGPFDFKDLFARLAIARSLQQGNTSFQSSMVMEVDLKNWTFDTESDMESRRHSLEEFLIGRVRAFAKKYERIVGLLRDLGRTASLAQWMGHILPHCFRRANRQTLVVIVNHWDAPIFSALRTSGDNPQQLDFGFLTSLLKSFTDLVEQEWDAVPRYLIAGHIPWGTWQTNIAILPEMKGAFGITREELQSLFSVFYPGRELDVKAVVNLNADSDRRMGYFIPGPPSTWRTMKSHGVFNMTMALEFVARTADLPAAMHYVVPEDPLWHNIARCCAGILEDSNLRWGYDVTVAPFGENQISSLVELPNNRRLLWALLTYLSVLKAEMSKWDPKWALSFSGSSVRRELLYALPRIELSKINASPLDIAFRGLAEGDPHYLVNMIEVQLEREAVRDLDGFKEAATLQAIFGTIVRVEPRTATDPRTGKYIDRYLTQHGLITNPAHPHKSGERLYAVSTSESGFPLSGFGEFGFLDALVLPCDGLVIAVELKFINVRGLHRANISKTDAKCDAAFKTNTLAYEASIAVIDLVKNLSLEELRALPYVVRHQVGHSWVTEETFVGRIIDDAIKQLISYLRALWYGRLQTAETRRTVKNSGKGDRLIGYVICGIAQRVVAIEVELEVGHINKTDNKTVLTHTNGYCYSPQSGWAKTWEKKVYNQGKK